MRAPATIGRYAVLEELASGGMGVVHRARDPQGREVALKVLRGEGLISPVSRQRLLRECQALRGLDHPGIVRCLDAGEDAGVPYLVMELLPGRALLRRLEEGGRLPVPEAVAIARELAAALAHAHARGVLHRDVKPANVIATPEGRHVLVDFGLARLLLDDLTPQERLSRTGQMLGTPGYWAPEQALGEKGAATPAADVHGLGATLYALLLGRTPYEGTTLTQLFDAQARGPTPPRRERPEVDPALDGLVMRCLARDPAARPTAAEVEAALAVWGAPAPASPVRRRALALAATLLLAAGGAALWARSSPRPAPSDAPSASASSSTPAPALPPGAPSWFATTTPRPPLPLPDGLGWGAGPGEYLHTRTGQVLVWIPPGRFVMGGEDGDADERPPRAVELRGFFLAKYETSWLQWLAFCAAERRAAPSRQTRPMAPPAPLEHPAFFVSWDDAQLYCRWAGLRLPSEAEWEYAARGAHGGRWPWGDAPPDASRLNVADASARWSWPAETVRQGARKAPWDDGQPWTAPVDACPAGSTPWGCLNMAGNVNEWTQDRYHPSYAGAPADGSAWEAGGEPTKRVFRGGCHYYGVEVARAAYRARAEANQRYAEQGLRVALSRP